MAEVPTRRRISGPQASTVVQAHASGSGTVRFTVEGGGDLGAARVMVAGGASDSHTVAHRAVGNAIEVDLEAGGPYTVSVEIGSDRLVVEDLLVGEVWLLGGQSNMQGAELATPDAKSVPLARMFSVDRTWKEARDPLHRIWEDRNSVQLRIHPVMYPESREWIDAEFERIKGTPEQAGGGVGPGLGFASALIELTGRPVGLVPTALGSTSLELWTKAWGDANAGPDDPSGSLFWNLIWRGRHTGATSGLAWYQGEADSAAGAAETYAERFLAFLNDVRRELGVPDLPALVVQISSVDTSDERWQQIEKPETVYCWETVREQIRTLPARDPRIRIAVAADLPKYDFGHVSADGQWELGRRLARAALALRGQGTTPDVARIDGSDAASGTVRVLLTGVNGRLTPNPEITRAFELRDAANHVRVPAQARVTADAIELTFDGPVDPSDRLVHGPRFMPQLAGTDDHGLPLPCFGPLPVGS